MNAVIVVTVGFSRKLQGIIIDLVEKHFELSICLVAMV